MITNVEEIILPADSSWFPEGKDVDEETRDMFRCHDCFMITLFEYYMVNFPIWEKYGIGDNMLCITCLEKRMGRTLAPQDFLGCLLNGYDPYVEESKSALLISRLYGDASVSEKMNMHLDPRFSRAS